MAKGGGAWKVAYADFVTAMMAFFLVMWICGQDQQIRRAVSYYFNDPVGASNIGNAKKPSKAGAAADFQNTGSIPKSESVALGKGRNSYSSQEENGATTKIVSDWLLTDAKASRYWKEQAQQQRDVAAWSKESAEQGVDKVAARKLAKQLREQVVLEIHAKADGFYKDLLLEAVSKVNWVEIAEDFVAD